MSRKTPRISPGRRRYLEANRPELILGQALTTIAAQGVPEKMQEALKELCSTIHAAACSRRSANATLIALARIEGGRGSMNIVASRDKVIWYLIVELARRAESSLYLLRESEKPRRASGFQVSGTPDFERPSRWGMRAMDRLLGKIRNGAFTVPFMPSPQKTEAA